MGVSIEYSKTAQVILNKLLRSLNKQRNACSFYLRGFVVFFRVFFQPMSRELNDDFQLDSEEERKIAGYSLIEKEKYKAKKYQEMQMRREAEILSKHKEEYESFNKQPSEENEPQAIKETFVLTRNTLIKGVFRPNFNIIKGCFVKIRVNEDYRICKILGVQETDAYFLNPAKKTKDRTRCRFGLNLEAGKRNIAGWPIANVSDRPVTSEEVQRFIENYRPSHEALESIIRRHKVVCNEFSRNMTNAEITEFISRKNRANPQKLSNTEIKMNIIKRRDAAIARKDKVAAGEAQKELEMIEDREFADRMKTVYNKEDLEKSMAKRKEASTAFGKNKLQEEEGSCKLVKKSNLNIEEISEEELIGFFNKKEEKRN
ncbi:hypothetical protein NUSPORA_00412 [Nucleospora cyclopteri]